MTVLFSCFVRLCLLSRFEAHENYIYNLYFENTCIMKAKTEQQIARSDSV